jgi:hypothetical protein
MKTFLDFYGSILTHVSARKFPHIRRRESAALPDFGLFRTSDSTGFGFKRKCFLLFCLDSAASNMYNDGVQEGGLLSLFLHGGSR